MFDEILTNGGFSSHGGGRAAAGKITPVATRPFLKRIRGFTLIEMVMVLAILAILAAIAIPSMLHYKHKAMVARTISELKSIETALVDYSISNQHFPESLDEVGFGDMKDCWGNPYAYTRVEGTPTGKLRKDKFLVPVNTDFDLYSRGKDGKSVSPFTAKASRDDVVRANNGGYFGLVSMY